MLRFERLGFGHDGREKKGKGRCTGCCDWYVDEIECVVVCVVFDVVDGMSGSGSWELVGSTFEAAQQRGQRRLADSAAAAAKSELGHQNRSAAELERQAKLKVGRMSGGRRSQAKAGESDPNNTGKQRKNN